MSEKEKIVAEITEKATKEAQAKKLNSAQTKLYVDEQIKLAVAELEKEEKKAESKPEKAKDKEKDAESKPEKEEKYIVKTPVKNFNGEVAGVQFAYGKAEVKPGWVLNWFKEHGYKVEKVK